MMDREEPKLGKRGVRRASQNKNKAEVRSTIVKEKCMRQ